MNKLIKRAKQGDSEAFSSLFNESALTIWHVALSILHDEELANDALQETALKAWKAIPSFKERCSLETWLVRIAINSSYDIKSKLRHEEPVDFAAIQKEDSMAHPDKTNPQLRNLLSSDSKDQVCNARIDVQRTLERLSANDRLLLTLFYAEDYPTKHIANIMGTTDSALRARLSRARSRFKDIYNNATPRGE